MKYLQHLTDICRKCAFIAGYQYFFQPYIYTAYDPRNGIFIYIFYPPIGSKKYRNFWGEVWYAKCISFFSATIFKNLQPSDFFDIALQHTNVELQKKSVQPVVRETIVVMVELNANEVVTFSCVSRLICLTEFTTVETQTTTGWPNLQFLEKYFLRLVCVEMRLELRCQQRERETLQSYQEVNLLSPKERKKAPCKYSNKYELWQKRVATWGFTSWQERGVAHTNDPTNALSQ